MKKTNVEKFKEVTHDIEFFSDLATPTIITCGKLIAVKRVENYYISMLLFSFGNYNHY